MIKGNSNIHFLNHFFLRFLPGSSADYSTNTTKHSATDQGAPDAYAAFCISFAVYDKFIIYNIPIGQGTKTMTQVINDFENLLVDERLIIAENECFRFMAKNCIAVYDEMLGVKYSKKKSKFKIDGVIAMLMGLLLCIEENGIEHYNPVEYLDAM